MRTVAIFSKPGKPELERIAPELVAWLGKRGRNAVVDPETGAYARGLTVVKRERMATRKLEFAIVLGGDGTLLAAARAVAQAEVPILGVNLGSLGFLSEVPLGELYPTLEAALAERCHVDVRAMLDCKLVRGKKKMGEYTALNDIVVNKGSIARIADFDIHIHGMFVSNYKADGVIVATPTGSTAYSMAAGGPILSPGVEAFVITPVSPHALTNRPLVVPQNSEISITVKNTAEEAYLTVDGQVGTPVKPGDMVVCSRSQHLVKLMRLGERTFFDVMRAKLKWGER